MPKFLRLRKIISSETVDLLHSKTVLVLGCGGVGGYVCEALVRSNIGRIIIVDFDTISESNINRQIIALESTLGLKKVDVLEKHLKDINSSCEVIKIDKFIDEDNIIDLFKYDIDYFVDACDTVKTKKKVIDLCFEKSVKFISCMGTGNRFDPTKLEVVDIRKTNNDPLARIMRKYIKDKKINKKVMVLSSSEVPVKTGEAVPGSSAFVPSAAGLIIASYVFKELINKK